jgi:hypothetical protein
MEIGVRIASLALGSLPQRSRSRWRVAAYALARLGRCPVALRSRRAVRPSCGFDAEACLTPDACPSLAAPGVRCLLPSRCAFTMDASPPLRSDDRPAAVSYLSSFMDLLAGEVAAVTVPVWPHLALRTGQEWANGNSMPGRF